MPAIQLDTMHVLALSNSKTTLELTLRVSAIVITSLSKMKTQHDFYGWELDIREIPIEV